MVKNGLKMLPRFTVLLFSSCIIICSCNYFELVIFEQDEQGFEKEIPNTIEAYFGTNITLKCMLKGPAWRSIDPQLVWGRRTKDLNFVNETDLRKLAMAEHKGIYDLYKDNEESYMFHQVTRSFIPFKSSDRGVHFCASLGYMLFKIIHIKVKENGKSLILRGSQTCNKDKFECVKSKICINSHYKCDGKPDCYDSSDESWSTCHGDPCQGKIQCRDGRCIPTSWCCNKYTDDNCTVAIRPSCCPTLPDPYDSILFYDEVANHVPKDNGPRYLFISICVVTGILSFVLFLFIISKVCNFDRKPSWHRNIHAGSSINQTTSFANCQHSECAIRREFDPNSTCRYPSPNRQNINFDRNEIDDPLIAINVRLPEISDLPPPYAEVVTSTLNNDKSTLDDLINAPPPPYSSTNRLCETERGIGNNISASIFTNNNCNGENTFCDIATTGDRSIGQ